MKKYEPMVGDSIQETCRVLVDMANGSGEPASASFNEVEVVANPGDNASALVEQFHNECNRRHEEYVNSPEYKKRQEQAKKKHDDHNRALNDALSGAPKEMTVSDEDGWKKTLEANPDGYGRGVVSFAERWARLMEARIAKGDTVEACAKETCTLADNEGITGFMYGCAVSILSKVWAHGEQLRRWHNKDTQLGTEGDEANEKGGVLNPALLCVR